ncbi:MAG: hypothetical protein AAGD35_01870 [Actinomycetota bacterium]
MSEQRQLTVSLDDELMDLEGLTRDFDPWTPRSRPETKPYRTRRTCFNMYRRIVRSE